MLNFLCADIEVVIDEIMSGFGGFIVVVIGIIAIIAKAKKKGFSTSTDTDNDDDGKYPFGTHPNATGQLTPEQSRYLQNNKRKAAQRNGTPVATTTTATTSTIDFHDDGHSHGGTAETYDPIVGSLGAVSDEGCDELNGVRLIASDLMYETDDEGKTYNMDVIRKSLVLGEILNNPRFKTPYGKK